MCLIKFYTPANQIFEYLTPPNELEILIFRINPHALKVDTRYTIYLNKEIQSNDHFIL